MEGLFAPEKVKKPDQTLSNLASLKKEMEEVQRKINAIKLDTVSVDNLDEIKLHLRNELSKLAQKVGDIVESIKIPTSIKVSNFPKQLDTVKVEEITELIKVVNDLRVIMAQVEFQPTINVESPKIDPIEVKIPPIKVPQVNVPAPQVKVEPVVDIDLSDLLSALEPLRLLSNKPSKPISVRMSDGNKWVKAFKEAGDKVVRAFAQAPGMNRYDFRREMQTMGKGNHRAAIAVNATAQEIRMTSGKKTIEIINMGANDIYYGGAGVASTNGFPLYLRGWKSWSKVKKNWSIYVVCAATKTSSLRVVEYD